MTFRAFCGFAVVAAATTVLTTSALAATAPGKPTVPATPFDREVLAAKSAMMGEPKTAFLHAQSAAAAAAGLPQLEDREVALATAQWLEGEASIRMRKVAEAESYLRSAAETAGRRKPNSKLQGDVFRSQGRGEVSVGRVQQALARYQEAFRIYQRANEPRSEAMTLQDIAAIYSDARDYSHMLKYYKQSVEIYAGDPTLNLTSHNNRGVALQRLGRLQEAMTEFKVALEAAKQIKSGYLQAYILSEVGFTQMLMKQPRQADASAALGLEITARDADAKEERPFLQTIQGWAAAQQGDPLRGARLMDEAFNHADLNKTTVDFRDFHEVAARVYEQAGREREGLAHLKAFKRLDDQARDLAASTNAALMSAQFDFANQDLKIAKLKAGELEAQARIRTIVVGAVLLIGGGAFIASLLGFFSMRRSRNQIRSANDQLGVANSALERALKAKTEFLATTSHEIRTPLNGILGMTQVILADHGLSDSVRERLNLVQGAGETMKSLVDDLLDVAKVENGSLTVHLETFDMHRLLKQAELFWGGQAQSKNLKLLLEVVDAPQRIIADEARLRQVVFNLVSNAFKFTEAGSVTLRATTEQDWLVVTVEDTGIGIPEHEHERIFEAFTQVDTSTSRKYGGTGLGLSICRSVSQAMGGSISVRSSEGDGATFMLRIPLVMADAREVQTEAFAKRLEDAAVLIVDANPMSQSMLKALMTPACMSVSCVNSIAAALDHLATTRVDLVVADATVLVDAAPARLEALRKAGGSRLAVTWPVANSQPCPATGPASCDAIILKPAAAADILAVSKAVLQAEPAAVLTLAA